MSDLQLFEIPPMPDLELFDDWLVADGALPNTRRAYLGHIRRSAGAATAPDTLRSWTITSILHVPRGTAGQIKAAVQAWFRYQDWPVPTFPRGRRAVRKPRTSLTAVQLTAYYKRVKHGHLSPPVRCILLLLPRTALRVEEACNLRRRHLTRRGRGFRLEVLGKGGHTRVIPLTVEAARILNTYLDTHRPDLAPAAVLFPGLRTPKRKGELDTQGEAWGIDPPIRPESIRKALRGIRKVSTLTPHVLRHTWATRSYQAGTDLIVLKELLGHTNIATTAIYVRASESQLRKAVERAELKPAPKRKRRK